MDRWADVTEQDFTVTGGYCACEHDDNLHPCILCGCTCFELIEPGPTRAMLRAENDQLRALLEYALSYGHRLPSDFAPRVQRLLGSKRTGP